jgi:hypothetical protein
MLDKPDKVKRGLDGKLTRASSPLLTDQLIGCTVQSTITKADPVLSFEGPVPGAADTENRQP